MKTPAKFLLRDLVEYQGQKAKVVGRQYRVSTGVHSYRLEFLDSDRQPTVAVESALAPYVDKHANLEARVSKLEATVAAMNGIDEPTIERCMESLRNAIDEVVDALDATHDIVNTPVALSRLHAALLVQSHIAALGKNLGVSHE